VYFVLKPHDGRAKYPRSGQAAEHPRVCLNQAKAKAKSYRWAGLGTKQVIH
jgi:hypothetical protein